MPRERADFTTDEDGTEHHPAFGVARIGRISATPGEVLFQSDLQHREYIQLTVSEAARERHLKDDFVFPAKVIFQIMMSMSQFASLIASGDTVPVTIEYTEQGQRPGLKPQSRLAETTREVRRAADDAFADIREAQTAYEDTLARKAPAKERNNALHALHCAIANAPSNVEIAAKRLAQHAEAVVEKSRADIEAMAASAQRNADHDIGVAFSPWGADSG